MVSVQCIRSFVNAVDFLFTKNASCAHVCCDGIVTFQYGFVNYALELLVLKTFGEETWEKIK